MVAQWWGFRTVREFESLPTDIQAENIAVYRTHHQENGVVEYERYKARKTR